MGAGVWAAGGPIVNHRARPMTPRLTWRDRYCARTALMRATVLVLLLALSASACAGKSWLTTRQPTSCNNMCAQRCAGASLECEQDCLRTCDPQPK